jgi:signal peptide peptidase SppA
MPETVNVSAIVEFIQTQAWAIREDVLDQIYGILYNRLVLGQDVPVDFVAGSKTPIAKVSPDESAMQNIAIIPVEGIIAKRMNMIRDVSAVGTSTELLQRDIEAALNDPAIDAIVLRVSSPGGMVHGPKEVADYIRANRTVKPILAHADSQASSAAYWIAAAAEKLTAYDTSSVGSIGVLTRHDDLSGKNEREGKKSTYIYAGKYKVLGNDTEPLSNEAREDMQNTVDKYYTMFVDAVAQGRGVSARTVNDRFGQGKSFLASEALERGMIDKIMTLDDTVKWAAKLAQRRKSMGSIKAEDFDTVLALENLDDLYGRDDAILSIEPIAYQEVVIGEEV